MSPRQVAHLKNEILVQLVEARISSFLKTAHDPNEPEWMRRYFQRMAERYMELLDRRIEE